MTDNPSIVAVFENIDVYGRNPPSVLTCPVGGWMGGWVGGWISWKYSHLSPAKDEARAELGNTETSWG